MTDEHQLKAEHLADSVRTFLKLFGTNKEWEAEYRTAKPIERRDVSAMRLALEVWDGREVK